MLHGFIAREDRRAFTGYALVALALVVAIATLVLFTLGGTVEAPLAKAGAGFV